LKEGPVEPDEQRPVCNTTRCLWRHLLPLFLDKVSLLFEFQQQQDQFEKEAGKKQSSDYLAAWQ
jgi:hypothetical protein